ncbi:hypothetical protein D9615_005228 [Tricholomella constricta]|uniref:Phospholipid/glycerol acyltransferase domain-containing protein n=1 Tax=Tricholomella constricta TaxID=117010 RepID=A0A8H5M1M8_9AGAR|nr:hypothetical protein D9615_005228 [Tricholomella constricta]
MPVVKDNDPPPPRREAKSVPILSLNRVDEALDVFVERPEHDIHYKTLSWQFLALLMIAEIVSNGMLSLPSSLAVIGIVPAVILIVFLGIFGLFTAKLLIDFKLNHPSVHNMGDAGFILGGPLVREVLSLGTVIFAIAGTGSELLSGQQALSALSNNGLCSIYILLVFSFATLVIALPRTLGRLSWLGFLSVSLISLAGIVAMVGAGLNPTPSRSIRVTASTSFDQAFLAITNPVFSYAGHFMFFILISEMRHPEDAMKAAWCLQGFATMFYTVFAVVIYVNIGDNIASPAFLSLPPEWAKVSYGIALANFLIAGGLYSHTAAKLFFIRFFRHSRHMYNHTPLGCPHILVSNRHRGFTICFVIYADWWYAWCLTYFIGPQGVHRYVYITLKKSLQWVPIVGWGMQLFNFIFLARSWASDRVQLASQLSSLGKCAEEEDNPLCFLLYPEGTLVSQNTRPVSKKFADKMGIADLTNVLLPRSTGLHYSLRSLAPRIPELKLIDLTMMYPGIPPMGYGQDYYTLRSIFMNGIPPPRIHVHLKMFDVAADIPIGDMSTKPTLASSGVANGHTAEVEIPDQEKEVFETWLRELWQAKDDSMTRFYETGTFCPGTGISPVEIPLKLRHWREFLDAFCFFLPAGAGYLWGKIRQ